MTPDGKQEPMDLEDDGIEIVKTQDINLFRQTIHLASQENFIPTLTRMENVMRPGKFTGRTVIHWNQGGVKKIDTEQERKA